MNLNPEILRFLNELQQNNNREWFNENKSKYLFAKEQFELFVAKLLSELGTFDNLVKGLIPKDCTFRIYRDTRFSKDKSPYKNNMGAYMVPGGKKSEKAGYYFHLEPGNSFIAGGMHMPSSINLKLIRERIYNDVEQFKMITEEKNFNELYPKIYGDKLKTAPKGFPKDWEHIEILRHKSFAVVSHISEEKLASDGLIDYIINAYKTLKPFNDYMNEIVDVNT